MYKTTQEFTFTISQDSNTYSFTGYLVFMTHKINSIGTVHTEDELAAFSDLLNGSLPIPEYWTLELLAQHLYEHARPIFDNLYSIKLCLNQNPQRVSEYSKPYKEVDGDILELGGVA